ncbi:D-alanyl-D-alanine carboxypeptidase/D-alanyl-D-alanine-endopeptidase [Neobacillus cucumis]|uniref:D-alanyl-D-alanine carboxypeptidase/D-alanyl-D-alanine endopeptidase n=1 Tax=Neobacillus cucumis TaxID=1740721 RepID=UPI0020402C3E|nr:D-alanyl-D-alanine carboxypeptidase/D-alanyl-D-alanine-endopeptidase [Neobacillus cucumis]MCM3729439.1 D-alanyl-D-alanine carboxypeptidase/D-alanyl-D-alanine-endopeptidase [Neobacillus cucumis]
MIRLVKNTVIILTTMVISITPYTQVKAMSGYENMSQQLNQIIMKDPALQGAIAGISVRSAANGAILYDYQGDVRLRPASNMKLLTAAAALKVLGENYTFATEVQTDAKEIKKTIQGNLYLKGNGDPTLLKDDFDNMAMAIEKLGVKKIKGNLVADDSRYDHIRYSLDMPWSDESTYYGAQISALTVSPTKDYDSGSIKVKVEPGSRIGDKVKVTVTPKSNYVKIINRSVTVAENGKKKMKIEREHSKNTVTIEGTLPLKTKEIKEWIGVWDPTRFAATLFRQALADHGITVTGKIKTGTVPEQAKLLTKHQSMPLSELLVPFMKLSNNVHAEMLIKEMGMVKEGEGTWEKGLSVLKSQVATLGANPNTMVIRDGSGISHVDCIPANQLSLALFAVQKEKWFPAYLHALPVAGNPEKMVGGSLRKRMNGPSTAGKVKAKTGTLSTVTSLSGYVNTKSGQTLIFSFLLNNMLDETKGKKVEDALVTILANQ